MTTPLSYHPFRRSHALLVICLTSFLLSACSLVLTPPAATVPVAASLTASPASPIAEALVRELALAGPITARTAELSGLAWYGDHLILLPQYPDFSGEEGDGFLYAIPKQAIRAVLHGESSAPIEPQRIPLRAPGLRAIPGYDGLEAIGNSTGTKFT
ncbi:MAG: hypothetical protein HC802_09110 [Caldilineaceae bacterium]|nr:hypothetical protein [Caldilineaceae bacterium]